MIRRTQTIEWRKRKDGRYDKAIVETFWFLFVPVYRRETLISTAI